MRLFLDRIIKRIEREGNDDLLQLSSLGPQFFPTPDLYDLLEQLERQKETVALKISGLYKISGLILVVFIGCLLANYFSQFYLFTALLTCVPIFGIFLAYRSIQIRRQHPTYFRTKTLEQNIRLELQRRREESSIF